MFNLSAERRRDLAALLAYFLFAFVLTYPLLVRFGTHVAGDGSDDPALAWNLWWVRYAIFDLGRSPIYTDYLFFPIGLNLAFYTLTYLNAFISIPVQFAFGLIPAANVNLILSFALGGFGAYLLVSYLLRDPEVPSGFREHSPFAAFAAGLLYAFSSNKFLYASLGQFNIASSQWIPFYILILLKLLPTFPRILPPSTGQSQKPGLRHGFLLGLFLLLQALSEFIFASFLILFTIAYLVYWLIANRFQIKHWQSTFGNFLVAALTFLLPMSPILAAMISDTLAEGDFIQSGLGFSNVFSADLLGFLVPSHLHPIFGGLEAQLHFSYINFVYLGYVAMALGAIALLRVPRSRIWGIWFALVFLITLGPTLRVNGTEFSLPFLPFNALLEIPLIKGNRYPSRWSVLLALCLAVLVGYGLAWVLKKVASYRPRGPARSPTGPAPQVPWGLGMGSRDAGLEGLKVSNLQPSNLPTFQHLILPSAVCLLLLFEYLSIPLPTSDFRVPEIYRTIAREPGNFTVMELPLAWRNGFRVTGSYRADSQTLPDRSFMLAQWYQTAQQHPILNGNTSRNPELKFQYFAETPVLDSLIAIQTGHSLDEATRARDKQLAPRLLQFLNVRYVIWHTPTEAENRDVANKTRAYVEDIFPLTKIEESYENGRGLVVYRVNDLPLSDALTIKPDDPLARLYLGEGWGALGGDSFWVTRQTAKIFLPLASARSVRIRFNNMRTIPSQGMGVDVNGRAIVHEGDFVGNSYTTAPLPSTTLHAGINEITLNFDRLEPPSMTPLPSQSIGQTGVSSVVSIVVRSAGEEQGDFGHIYVNGVDESPNARGYNLVVIDSQSGKVEARANFDTFASEGDSTRLAEFIGKIPNGKIVAIAARDEASYHLTAEAVAALQSVGARQDLRGKFRWSHAILGVKGAAAGSALEAASETRASQLILGVGATEPNIAATIGEIQIEPQQ